jgi:hypothetical protein
VGDPDWGDWNQAAYQSLASADPALADQLADRLVVRLLTAAGLSAAHRTEAFRQVRVEVGRTPKGAQILRVRLPLGEGEPEYEWDGSQQDAEQIIDSMADIAAESIVDDQFAGLPTGWEPEPT